MDFPTPQARRRYGELVDAAEGALTALDFDGTLSPIVADPAQAAIHPDGPGVLARLAGQVRAVAVITGRPAREVVDLARLTDVASGMPEQGRLLVLGQYGNERWDSGSAEFSTAEPPTGLAAVRAQLPAVLARAEAQGAHVEDKRIAIAVHTRRLADPQHAFERLLGPLGELAAAHGLSAEPGRMVVEVRAPGMDKGSALHRAVAETGASAVVFAGDDLGDLPAFAAAEQMRAEGMPALLVCSGSHEQTALAERADLVVDGPAGMLDFLSAFADDVSAGR